MNKCEIVAVCFIATISTGGQELRIRPGVRVPQRSVEDGTGDQTLWEELDPKGDAWFIVIRGRL